MTVVVIAALIPSPLTPDIDVRRVERIGNQEGAESGHVVFLGARTGADRGRRGWRRQSTAGSIRRAQGVGADPMTLRVGKPPPSTVPLPAAPAVASEEFLRSPQSCSMRSRWPPGSSNRLDCRPAASTGASTGPGSGGGVGSGSGIGTGSGSGPGLGPGSGGGSGGGIYRPGGAVSAPRLIKETKPGYTSDALRNGIQGTVVLETIVTAAGCASEIRIVRSLDPGGLDQKPSRPSPSGIRAWTAWSNAGGRARHDRGRFPDSLRAGARLASGPRC